MSKQPKKGKIFFGQDDCLLCALSNGHAIEIPRFAGPRSE